MHYKSFNYVLKVNKYFDAVADMIDDVVCVMQDKLSDQETIIQKLSQIIDKKIAEIDEKNLYRLNTYVEFLHKEFEK